jgi:hypothetical protein
MAVTVGSVSTSTNGSGNFSTGMGPSGVQAITISGPGYFTRNTFGSTNSSLTNPLTLISSGFDMAAYDDIVRETTGTTIRWMSGVSIYVDTRPEVGTGMAIPAHWISATQSAAGAYPGVWSSGLIGASVTTGTTPPADGTPNTIVIRYDNNVNPSGCGGTVGQAQISWFSTGQLRWGVIRLALSRLCSASSDQSVIAAVVGHEIGHTFGLGHSDLAGRSSLMQPTISILSPTALDNANANVHYHRSPQHANPDQEPSSYSGMNFSRVPALAGREIERTVVCGGDPRPSWMRRPLTSAGRTR